MAGDIDVGRRKPKAGIDRFVAMRIRERRIALGMTQRELALHLGATPMMLSKYEKSGHSVSAAMLYEIAGHLSTSPEYFFEGFDDHRSMELLARHRLLLTFMRSVIKIDSESQREALRDLVRGLAGASSAAE